MQKIIDGRAVPAELSLYEQRANSADHRPGLTGRDGADQKFSTRLMCKMVVWLPRDARTADRNGTLYVRTDTDALLVALNVKDERLWVENCDQLRRWTAEHARRLQRLSEDKKCEQRPRAKFQGRREAAALKYRRRLDSLCHEVAAHLANFAARRRFAVVRYDDTMQQYCPRLPWGKLRDLIEQKLDERGIQFERPDAKAGAAANDKPS